MNTTIIIACIITAIICFLLNSLSNWYLNNQIKYLNRYNQIANTILDCVAIYLTDIYSTDVAKSTIENATKMANNRLGLEVTATVMTELVDEFMDDIKKE